jgi:hypothetical protein
MTDPDPNNAPARETRHMTRGLDAMNAEEWRTIALQLAETLRQVRAQIDDALADAGLE